MIRKRLDMLALILSASMAEIGYLVCMFFLVSEQGDINGWIGGKLLNNQSIVDVGLALVDSCWNTYASTT